VTVKERKGPVLFCGKCGNELKEWNVGMLWHIRPGDGVADAPKGPSRGGNPRSTSRRGSRSSLGLMATLIASNASVGLYGTSTMIGFPLAR